MPELCKLLQFCLSNMYFAYCDTFYNQVRGTGMGSSILVTAANLVTETIEEKALEPFTLTLEVFYRYVDDCFCVLRRDDFARFPPCLNSVELSIQFTGEQEENSCLPLLDILV